MIGCAVEAYKLSIYIQTVFKAHHIIWCQQNIVQAKLRTQILLCEKFIGECINSYLSMPSARVLYKFHYYYFSIKASSKWVKFDYFLYLIVFITTFKLMIGFKWFHPVFVWWTIDWFTCYCSLVRDLTCQQSHCLVLSFPCFSFS